MNQRQKGFTLIEIAIVLVIIGLLLGGILKGQELINSARVRNLADTSSGIQAAYYGFIDRYRRIPGDWNATAASTAIGQTVTAGGNDNGRIDSTAAAPWKEPLAAWQQLALAGFIQGTFNGGTSEPTQSSGTAPLNAFNAPMLIGRTPDYQGANGNARLQLVIGRFVPVTIMRELDVKIDDSRPDTGDLRSAVTSPTVFAGTNNWGGTSSDCRDSSSPVEWNITADEQDCNSVFLY